MYRRIRTLSEFQFAVIFFSLFCCFAYFDFLILKRTPLGPSVNELNDPAVSPTVFAPAIDTIRYELFHHGTLLWSSLRGFGQPLLASEVQGAPLFPLTLLTIAVPSPWFWNVFCLLRLVLIGIGCFLFACRPMGFTRLGAILFTITFGYSIYAMRWMNHAWQNGFCAGIWYLFFIGELALVKRNPRAAGIGLALSAYSLLTCGFPEASALMAILTVLIYAPHWRALHGHWRPLILANGIGLAIGAPQFLALTEYIGMAGVPFRSHHGIAQYENPAFFLQTIARLTDDIPRISSIHFFNLIPLCLACLGLTTIKRSDFRREFALSSILAAVFFVFKLFPVFPLFNLAVGSLPILTNCLFTTYFFPLILFPFAFWVARGGEALKGATRTKFSICAIVTLILLGCSWQSQTNLIVTRRIVGAVVPFGILVLLWLSGRFRSFLPQILLGLVAFEFIAARPMGFGEIVPPDVSSVRQALQEQNLSPHELRNRDGGGNLISLGIATIDMGSPPILPKRTSDFRTALFTPEWPSFGPHIIFHDQRVPYSWRLTATSLWWKGDRVTIDREALSRAYVPKRCLFASSAEEARGLVADPERFQLGDAVIENPDKEMIQTCGALSAQANPVRILQDRGSSLVFDKISGPAVLLVSDSHYPGWRAEEIGAGKSLTIFPANLAFRAIALPDAKEYNVRMIYIPTWWRWEALSVLLGLTLSVMALVPRQPKTRRNDRVLYAIMS
ncbi:MAG: hypothetical protein HYR96_04580 [Deltaproteobacteria bacterium]|nr:hypothetical protein [Deltaproteobacteria bacterium]MBI3295004.1 hypothetical protein [Deltaproteobacteria bacterium]